MNKLIVYAAVSLLAATNASGAAPLPPASPPAVEARGVGAERVQLPASQGTINFPHRKHQEMLKDCSNCHANSPGKIPVLGKAWAHETCRGCHNETAKAPVQCSGCHDAGIPAKPKGASENPR